MWLPQHMTTGAPYLLKTMARASLAWWAIRLRMAPTCTIYTQTSICAMLSSGSWPGPAEARLQMEGKRAPTRTCNYTEARPTHVCNLDEASQPVSL